ncbi:SpoIIE family protein phosphatase [Kineococcus glutinatus]|uniref:STAS domain-containing protein n=1 Tax=Kineococcus glutinatus TaxID=1070872 RepID=A0ABP9HCZ6_9ACTN
MTAPLDVVAALQRALLPHRLPVLPCADVAARYLVAGAERGAGGDWFDALPVPGGGVALVVGDVVGHGLAAAATMSQLRAVVAQRLHLGANVAEALADLDEAAALVPDAAGTTVCVALLDLPGGRLVHATRGHPAPLVVGGAGARFLPTTGGGPLGSGVAGAPVTGRLDPDDVLVLFTDGLVERPGRPHAQGLADLATAGVDAAAGRVPAPEGTGTAERVCAHVAAALAPGGGGDDATVLVVQLRRPVAPLRVVVPTDAEAPGGVRSRLRAWLRALEVTDTDRLALELATSEAVANAVVHSGSTAPVEVVVELGTDGAAHVLVADGGRWVEPRALPGEHGRGLGLIAALTRHLVVEHRGGGTVVRFQRALTRSVPPTPATWTPPAAAGEPFACELLDERPLRLRVRGEVDAAGADRLGAELLRAARGGLVPVVADLDRVTHLGSAGVRVLAEVVRTTARTGSPVRLAAAGGTAAAFVLDLVALPRVDRTGDPATG